VRLVVVLIVGSLAFRSLALRALGALGTLGALTFVIVIRFPREMGNVGVEVEVRRRVNSAWWEWVFWSFGVVRSFVESRNAWVWGVAGDTAL
jgi:hypothetical protein